MKKERMRLDKLLAHSGFGSRKDIKKIVSKGQVTVDGQVVKDSGLQVYPNEQDIQVEGVSVQYRKYVYLMLNKPAGVITATEDSRHETVLDLVPEEYRHFELFPVGRLDKDTEGLLILTNDGKLSHELLSPKKHVPKTYFAKVNAEVGPADAKAFTEGVVLDDGYKTMPAKLEVIKVSSDLSEIQLVIYEGKFHQVKRMFQAVDKEVIYLKRIAMGELALDESLELGEYRELTEAELELLKSNRC